MKYKILENVNYTNVEIFDIKKMEFKSLKMIIKLKYIMIHLELYHSSFQKIKMKS